METNITGYDMRDLQWTLFHIRKTYNTCKWKYKQRVCQIIINLED